MTTQRRHGIGVCWLAVLGLLSLGLLGCGEAAVVMPPALQVIEIAPHNGATNVPPFSASVEIRFNDALATGSITSTSVKLTHASGSVAAERLLEDGGQLLTLIPDQTLDRDTEYFVTVDATVTGVVNGELGQQYHSRFRTAQ